MNYKLGALIKKTPKTVCGKGDYPVRHQRGDILREQIRRLGRRKGKHEDVRHGWREDDAVQAERQKNNDRGVTNVKEICTYRRQAGTHAVSADT